ncbi:hypothetical protein NM208_g6596 [Fusarium decemcellulare]|uniref:Uncharacterized protein n=1 Tax=Fusarium decemcellulare TaxID=57161 RepID=A0ACC1SCB7_9HYPO|nr:hypothetical protein NM208_g6596 [Fusarium decemcellulare]
MFRFRLIFHLACLASLSALAAAQSCNTTGTYDSCCKSPSSDKKAVTFQGKEFRVHCDSVIAPDQSFQTSPADCANVCSSNANCVDAHWQPPTPPGRYGICEIKFIQGAPQSLAFVWIDSADQSECKKDLDKCQDDLNKCKPGDPTCPGKLGECEKKLRNCKPGDPTCPGKLGECEGKLKNCDPTCPGKLGECEGKLKNCKPGDPTCPGKLKKCQENNRKCVKDKNKCVGDLAKCKKKPPPKKNPGPFQCVNGKIENIGGARYRHICSQVQVRARSHQTMVPAADARDCARKCTQAGCKWVSFVNTQACWMSSFAWSSATKTVSSGYTVLERV